MAELSTLRKFEALGPFEIKNELIALAKKHLQDHAIGIPQRGPRQPQLDRHDAERGFLPSRAIRHHREQAGDG